ncbi:MAG: DUF3276 family protein [Chitinophagales bacterium]
MENEKNFDKNGVYSKRVRAGKRRTYFFDVRTTRGNDYYLTITESKKRADDDTYERHKIFIYKEDFMKFVNAMQETVDYIKTDLLPDYDFDAHNHDDYEEGQYIRQEAAEEKAEYRAEEKPASAPESSSIVNPAHNDEVDKWD